MTKRVHAWDELRGVAISFMIFVHFFYYNSKIYYDYNFFQATTLTQDFFNFFKGIINLHTSYLAPFLFLFIVGIISHIKFRKQNKPDIPGSIKRFLKLYLSAIVLHLIFQYYKGNILSVSFLNLPVYIFHHGGILMNIAFVYLINEYILLPFFNYFNLKIVYKIIVVCIYGFLILLFNIKTKSIFSSYFQLPMYFIVLSGLYTSLLGDLFVSLHSDKYFHNKIIFFINFLIIPLIVCILSLFTTDPSLGAIKEMNLVYFIFCFSWSAIIIKSIEIISNNNLFTKLLKILRLLGRHSLSLYLFHFFIGFTIEKFIFLNLVPKKFWPINIIFVFFSCLLAASLIDNFNYFLKKTLRPKNLFNINQPYKPTKPIQIDQLKTKSPKAIFRLKPL